MDWFKRTVSIAGNTGYNVQLLKGFYDFSLLIRGITGRRIMLPGQIAGPPSKIGRAGALPRNRGQYFDSIGINCRKGE